MALRSQQQEGGMAGRIDSGVAHLVLIEGLETRKMMKDSIPVNPTNLSIFLNYRVGKVK